MRRSRAGKAMFLVMVVWVASMTMGGGWEGGWEYSTYETCPQCVLAHGYCGWKT